MTTSTANEATALMRDAMDKALSAPTGVRLTFPDSKYGGPDAAKAEAERWAKRLFTARADMRRMIARSVADAEGGVGDKTVEAMMRAVPPDAWRTPYDALFTSIVRIPADATVTGQTQPADPHPLANAGWWLTILKADASALMMEII